MMITGLQRCLQLQTEGGDERRKSRTLRNTSAKFLQIPQHRQMDAAHDIYKEMQQGHFYASKMHCKQLQNRREESPVEVVQQRD